jgi:hypothetical protein
MALVASILHFRSVCSRGFSVGTPAYASFCRVRLLIEISDSLVFDVMDCRAVHRAHVKVDIVEGASLWLGHEIPLDDSDRGAGLQGQTRKGEKQQS